jgi:inner membrane transporter RhtA
MVRSPSLQPAWVAVFALFLGMVSLTSGAALAKSIFALLPPEGVTWLRLFFSAVALFVFLKGWRACITRQNLWPVLAYGSAIAGMNLFIYLAIETIPVGVAIAIELTGPLVVSAIFSKSRFDFFWVLLAAGGVYLLLPDNAATADLASEGTIYALIAGMFWGLYVVVGKKAGMAFGNRAAALGVLVAAIVVTPVFVVQVDMASLTLQVLGLGVVIALLSSAVPMFLEMVALRALPTKTYGVLSSGEPVVGALVGLIGLAELLTLPQIVGMCVIVSASVGTVLRR